MLVYFSTNITKVVEVMLKTTETLYILNWRELGATPSLKNKVHFLIVSWVNFNSNLTDFTTKSINIDDTNICIQWK